MVILSFEVSQNFLNSRVFNGESGGGCSKVITFVLDLETKDIHNFLNVQLRVIFIDLLMKDYRWDKNNNSKQKI
jgi:hypothetical protein